MKKPKLIKPLVSTLTMLSAFGVHAQSTPVSEVDQYIKPDSSVSIGVGTWTQDRSQMGIYDGMNKGQEYLLLDADIITRDDASGTWKTLRAQNLGLNTREVSAEVLEQGKQGLSLSYSKTTRVAPFTVNSNLTGFGTTTQTVGANITTAGAGVNNFEMKTERDKYSLGLYRNISEGFDFRFTYSEENKKGNRLWGRGGAAEFAAEPIDWLTKQLDAVFNYSRDKLSLSGGYYGSWFGNANKLVTSVGASTYYLSLPLDNEAHQLHLSGSYKFSPIATGNFKVAYTHAAQNDHLSTADIAGLAWTGAPSNLNGKIDTKLVQLGLSVRPTKDLNLVTSIRYTDVDDRTPLQRIVQTGAPGTTVSNTPYSYTTKYGKLEAIYGLRAGYSLIGGIESNNQDRTIPVGRLDGAGVDQERYVPFRAQLNETTYRAQLRKSLSEQFGGFIGYAHSRRDGSAYSEAVHSDPGEGTAINAIDPINIADRTRRKLRTGVDWTPAEKLSVQLGYETGKDEYSGHTYGLRDGKTSLVSLDASYAINEKWKVSTWVSRDTTEANQVGWREGSPAATGATYAELKKYDNLKDTTNAVGLGLRGEPISKTRVGADFQWIKTISEYNQDFTKLLGNNVTYISGTAGPLPDITNTATRLKIFAEYALKKDTTLRFDGMHERWKTDDWSWQFSNGAAFQYGTTTDGTSVIAKPKQNTSYVGLRYIYRFQ